MAPRILLFAIAVLAPACGASLDGIDAAAGGGSDEGGTQDGAPPSDGGVGDGASDGGDGSFCTTTGPLVNVGDSQTMQTLCTGQVAQAVFQNALCTCNDAELGGYLVTRGMNSQNPNAPDGGAPVGIDDTYQLSAGYTDVGGSMSIAGAQSVTLVGYVQVHGDLRLEGQGFVPGYTDVARNAWLGGPFTDLGPFTVGGDLHHAGNVGALPLMVKGQNVMGPVTIPPPCDCDPKDLLDVGALVDDAKLHNDDATIGLSPTALAGVVGSADLTLPCGKFFVTDISGLGAIHVHVTGRVALFVDDSITAAGLVKFELATGAELDLFIRNDLVLTGDMTFGDKSHPAATRIYVGGAKKVVLIGAAGFVGNLYAPRADVGAVGYADVWGSIFANNFIVPGYTHIVFDRAILSAGQNCPPPTKCNLCGVCASGLACVNGQCTTCKTDADCCGQATCTNGVCGPVIQ